MYPNIYDGFVKFIFIILTQYGLQNLRIWFVNGNPDFKIYWISF